MDIHQSFILNNMKKKNKKTIIKKNDLSILTTNQ